MGLFSASSEIDPRLHGVFAAPPDHEKAQQRLANKSLARESGSILAILEETGEAPLVIAHDKGINTNVIVVTNERTFQIKNGRIRQELMHSEVAETRLGAMPIGDTMVTVESISAQQDFRHNDPMRYSKIIQAQVATPRIGNLICGQIDRIIGQ